MLRSYWLPVFATIGWLATAFALAQAPSGQGVPAVSPSIQKQGTGQADTGKDSPKDFSIPIRIIEDPVEADRARDRDAKSQKHDADDLEAQRKAAAAAWKGAVAAERQINPAWWQVGFAFLGTVFLIWNLAEARKANRNALTAINNEQESARRQTRAYITVDSVAWQTEKTPPNKPFTTRINGIDLEIKNTGQTPAYKLECVVDCRTGSAADSALVIQPKGEHIPQIIVGAGATHMPPVDAKKVLEESFHDIAPDKLTVYVSGKVSYVDIFGETRWLTYNYRSSSVFKRAFEPCERSNEASEQQT